MTVSVATIVRNRSAHLARLVEGLNRQTRTPDELVIAYMQDEPCSLDGSNLFAIKETFLNCEPLPLAQARNAAAHLAAGDVLIFLDVDCIPGPNLVAAYANHIERTNACTMGEVRYLGAGDVADDWAFDTLWGLAETHPARTLPDPKKEISLPCSELWSLSFGLKRAHFLALGGFDEEFVGYGGEDTDFALRLDNDKRPLHLIDGPRAVHQWHEVFKPPLQHFEDIIANARRYYHKHGRWCMEYWLDQFEYLKLISREATSIEVIRSPLPAECEAARQPGHIRFS